jgi:hypothetical protein
LRKKLLDLHLEQYIAFGHPSKNMTVQKLQVGMAGLGRVGKLHAINFLQKTPFPGSLRGFK